MIFVCSFVLFALDWLSINTTKITKALSTRLHGVVFVVFAAIKNFDLWLWLYTLIYERFHISYESLVLALRCERVMHSCISSCDLQARVYHPSVITFSRHQIRQTFQSCIIWPHRDSGSTLAIYCVATWIMQSHAITYAWLMVRNKRFRHFIQVYWLADFKSMMSTLFIFMYIYFLTYTMWL